MNKVFTEDKEFNGADFTQQPLPVGDYEYCRFVKCNFSGTKLSHINFVECVFEDCDLSTANVANTAFKVVQFKNCKVLGVHFNYCNPFLLSLSFEGCILNFSSYYNLSLKQTQWKGCSLHEVDFNDADLTGAAFDNCDLRDAVFRNACLEKADFRTAINYSVDPEANKIKKARFSLPGIAGLLDKYDIVID